MKHKLIYLLVLVLGIIIGLFSMYFYISKNPVILQKTITRSEKKVKIDEKGISSAVDKIYDAVVTVSTYKNASNYASGTGFVFQKDEKTAYILTNSHVIKNADEVYVTFTNGNNEKAELIGSYQLADIAVLSVSSNKVLAVAEIGSSDESKIGDTVFTVGAPLGDAYSWSVTRGILSGKERLVEVSNNSSYMNNSSDTYMMNVIQTDAAINSGNSGGPLSNSNGEVIGITSMKLADTGVEGMGFAIPIETAIKYANKIINKEEIVTPYIGVAMLNINEAYYFSEFKNIVENLKNNTGVVLANIEKGSPAEKGDLKQGDVIIKLDGKKCTSIAYLRYILYTHEVGDQIKVTYLRDGIEKETTVTLSKSPN